MSEAWERRDGPGVVRQLRRGASQTSSQSKHADPEFSALLSSLQVPVVTFETLEKPSLRLVELFKQPTDEYVWLGPVLVWLLSRLVRSARKNNDELRRAKELLDSVFRSTTKRTPASSPGAPRRQDVSLALVNLQCQVYMASGTPGSCRQVLRSLTQPGFPAIESFSLSEQVKHAFLAGKLAVLEDDLELAHRRLSFAWETLNRRCSNPSKNARLILELLTAVQLARGFQPSQDLLRAHGLDVLARVAELAKRGEVSALSAATRRHRAALAKKGIYLMIARTRVIAQRQLVKRAVAAYRTEIAPQDDPNKLPLQLFCAAFAARDEPLGGGAREEAVRAHTVCALTNLISKGLMRAYVSLELSLVVMSQKEPFPRTASVLAAATEEEA